MVFEEQVNNRRAIEALRNGVPNRDAVRALGCNQPKIETAFIKKLDAADEMLVSEEGRNEGILIAGDFGSGKSHLLEHLKALALARNCVCSKVVVSKETPLYDPVKVYRAAAESAVIAGKRGNALTEAANTLMQHSNSLAYGDFYRWAHEDTSLNRLFPASLFLLQRMANDPEVSNRIIRFLCGDKINISEIKRYLRICGEQATYRFDRINIYDLALQRFKFVSRLFAAAGFGGWVLLIDEVELMARYSLMQRARSYAEIARWMGKLQTSDMLGITTVLAITEDFGSAVIDGKDDLEKAPNKLRASASEAFRNLAVDAEKGIKVIREDILLLRRPDDEDIRRTYEKVRSIHAAAYNWDPPTLPEARAAGTRMRQHVRGWITRWDLNRLDAQYRPVIRVEEITADYTPDPDLESGSEDDGEGRTLA